MDLRAPILALVAAAGLLALTVIYWPEASGEPVLPPLPPASALMAAPDATGVGEAIHPPSDPAERRAAAEAAAAPSSLPATLEVERIAGGLAIARELGDGALSERLAARLEAACAPVFSAEGCAALLANPEWGVAVARRVGDGVLALGMTGAQVKAAWGEPASTGEEVVGEMWCYDDECVTGVVLFEDRAISLIH